VTQLNPLLRNMNVSRETYVVNFDLWLRVVHSRLELRSTCKSRFSLCLWIHKQEESQ